MAKKHPPVTALFPERTGDDFSESRLRWLIRLRWMAMAGVLLAALLSVVGAFPGVAYEVLLAVAAGGSLYNFLLWRTHREGRARAGQEPAMRQALIDLAMLTVVLWAAGGIESPFIGYYVFHVALIGILGGPRATLIAVVSATLGTGLLWITTAVPGLAVGAWDPKPPWDLFGDVAAFTTTVAAAAYIVTHAVRELRDREHALARARDRAALEYQVLSNTLDELEAGLEVVEEDGSVLWRNKRAEELAPFSAKNRAWQCPGADRPCEGKVSGHCPIHSPDTGKEPFRCRFAAELGHGERLYEMLVFPLSTHDGDPSRVMNLYLDQTAATLAEGQLLLAERLASLGRVAQGVAHELNTPLATIRTLATDMRAALSDLSGEDTPQEERAEVVADLDESAALLQDETRRLGRITQALLAGGDLVRPQIDRAVPLGAVVERARALVFAGVRDGPEVQAAPEVDNLEVAADPDRLVQVLVNLLQNAYDAVRDNPRGHVSITAGRKTGAVELTVEDDGPGIDPLVADRLFEPFATTKPPGEGTGLGLYASYMLVRAMGGSLTLEGRESGGTRALVRLPTAASLASSSSLTQRAAP